MLPVLLLAMLLIPVVGSAAVVKPQCVSIKFSPPEGLLKGCTIQTKRCTDETSTSVEQLNAYMSTVYNTMTPELCVSAFNRPTECPAYGGVFKPALCQIGDFSCNHFTHFLTNCNTDAHCPVDYDSKPYVCCASKRKQLANMCNGPSDKMLDSLIDTMRSKKRENGGCRDTDCIDTWSAGTALRASPAVVLFSALAYTRMW